MVEIKLTGKSLEQRVSDRLANSGVGSGTQPDVHVVKGEGPLRTHTNIHHTPNKTRGNADRGDR
jgi:hypothetical protein